MTYGCIGSWFQIQPQIILQFEIDVGETDDHLADQPFPAHPLTTVQSQPQAHGIDILRVNAMKQKTLHVLGVVPRPDLRFVFLLFAGQQNQPHLQEQLEYLG